MGWTFRIRVQKFQGVSLKNGVGILTFVRKTCEIMVVDFNHLVSVYDQLWAINMTSHWTYAARPSNIGVKHFVGVPGGT